MTRVKKAKHALKSRKNILQQTKGFRHGRSKKERLANEARFHAFQYAFAHRRKKKNDFRRMWQVRINAATRPLGISYSKFIGAMKKSGFELDRKVLSQMAIENPESFERLVKKVSK